MTSLEKSVQNNVDKPITNEWTILCSLPVSAHLYSEPGHLSLSTSNWIVFSPTLRSASETHFHTSFLLLSSHVFLFFIYFVPLPVRGLLLRVIWSAASATETRGRRRGWEAPHNKLNTCTEHKQLWRTPAVASLKRLSSLWQETGDAVTETWRQTARCRASPDLYKLKTTSLSMKGHVGLCSQQ